MRRNTQDLWRDLSSTAELLKSLLSTGPVPLHEIHRIRDERRIKESDLNEARRSLQIETVRKQGTSFWRLPEQCD
ncbi:hypothetical protein [Brevibacillus brevis]|uniref:hypothetical protein n=1 Tax=Brevibacillus brevis TaxID=1393 RepID=UPI00165DB5C0|nr:hypothetical protein [Brevibacillus brevis]